MQKKIIVTLSGLFLFCFSFTASAQYYLDQYELTGQNVNFNRAQNDVYNGNHIFAVGDYSTSISNIAYLVIKTDTNGILDWAHRINTPGNGYEPFSIYPDKYNTPSTGMVIAGLDQNSNPVTFGESGNFMRVDSTGTPNLSIDFTCETYFGDGAWTVGHVAKATPGGYYYYMGSMNETGGNAAVAGGGYQVQGGASGYDPMSDIFIAKIATGLPGDTVFTQTIGLGYNFLLSGVVNCDSTRNDAPEDFVYDKATNGLYITGLSVDKYSPGGGVWRVQMFIMKTDTFGNPQWVKNLYLGTGNPSTTTAWEAGYGICQLTDGSGDLMVAGLINDDAGWLLVRISNTGFIEYAKEYYFGASSGGAARTVKPLSNGNVLVGGWIVDASSGGQSDFVSMEVNPLNMNVVNAIQFGTTNLDATDFSDWYGPDAQQLSSSSYLCLGNATFSSGNQGLMAAKYSSGNSNGGICSSTPAITVIDRTPGVAAVPLQVRVWVPGNSYLTAPNSLVTRVGSAGGGYTEKNVVTINANPSVTNMTATMVSSSFSSSASISISAGGATTFCTGGSVTLNASGGTTYTWSPATGLSATTGASVTASPASTTTYTVTGSNGACASGTATVTVTVNPNPTIVITPGGSTTLCSGGAGVTLTASGASTYTWAPSTGLSCTNCANPTANPASTTTYTVTGTNGAGCTGTQTVTVTVNTTPTVSITPGGSTTLCSGGAGVGLTASGATSYTWAPAGGLSCTNCANPNANPASTTTYTVTGTTAGCTSTATVTITVNTTPTVSITPAGSTTLCSGGAGVGLTASGATSYTWAPAAGLSCTTCANPNANPAGTTTYTVTGTTAGCTSTATVTITVNATPTVSITPAGSTTLCSGGPGVGLTASGATSYTWAPAGGLSCTNCANPNANPASTTTYTVTGTTAGCTSTATVTITVNITPTVSITPAGSTTLCSGGAGVGLTASGATSYTWAPAAGLSCTNCANPNANPAGTTTYTVTGTSSGCTSTATITITVNATPTVSITPAGSTTLCSGGPGVGLTASGATSYTWAPAGGLSCTNCPNPTANPGSTTTYTVTGTKSGCTSTATVTITVNATPTVSVIPVSPTICPGNSVPLTASGATSYTWSPGTGLSCTNCANPNANPASTTTYTVTGTSSGCTSTATVTVTVAATLNVTVTPGSPSICSGNSVVLNGGGAATYTWKPATGLSCTNCPSPTASPASTTTYTVVGVSGGCTDSNTVKITVNPTPTVSIVAPQDSVCAGGSVSITANGATSYTWAPATGLSCTNCPNPTASPASTTTYTVTGTTGGCTSKDSITIKVNPLPVLSIAITGISAAICPGDSMGLMASGASTYTWLPAGGLSCTNCPNPNASPAVTTTYTVTGTSTSGCINTDSIKVTVYPTPTVVVTPSAPSICSGSSSTLTATGANTYSWSPATGLSATTGSSVVASPAVTTTYTVNATSINGCPGSQTVTITVTPTPTMNVTPSTSAMCSGDSSIVTATGATTYTWAPGTGLSATTGSVVTAKPGATTTYTVVGSNGGGCNDTVQFTISINPTPTVNVNATTPSICSGNSTNITASGAGSYTWSPATGLSATTGATVSASPASTTTYTVVGSNGGGCNDTATVTINVTPTPTLTVTPPSPGICGGDSVTMTASGATNYTWAPGTGLNTTTGAVVDASPGSTTTYTITGTNGACSSTLTQTITVGALAVGVSATSSTICTGTSTTITATGAVTYAWKPATGLSSTTGSSVSANPASTTTYTVVGTSGACSDSNTITITVNPVPAISITPNKGTVCAGDSIALSATGATSYTWSPGGGLSCTNCPNPTASPGATTTFTVTGTTAGCSSTDTVTISVGSISLSVIPVSSSICNGNSTTINASGATNYTWKPGTGLSSTTGSSVSANPTGTTTYTIVGTVGASCIDSTTVTITVNPIPTISVSANDSSICQGNSSILTASGASNYTWSPGTGLSATTGSPVTASPTGTITYTVVGTSAGCSDSATFMLTVNPTPTITISLSGGDTLCKGQSETLTANGASNYTWSTGATTSSINVTPSGATTYSVKGANGVCMDSATVTLYNYPPMVLTMTKSDSICSGYPAQIGVSASGGKPAYNYQWNNGGGTGAGPVTVNPSSPTYYMCKVTDGCGDSAKDSVLIFTYPAPTAAFVPTPDTIWGGQYVVFTNLSSNATSYFWSFGDGSTDTAFMPYYTYSSDQGTYVVVLVAKNAAGCADTAKRTVYVEEGIIVPNVFTPNGDGINDVFHVTAGGLATYYIEIFNRWGEKVFEANSPNIDWTGRSTAGVQESDGTYYYIIKATDYKGKQYNLQGSLQLIRGAN